MASVELIEVENVRSVRKASIRLSSGVNFIYGLNGAGKTTILDSIAIALYGTDWLKRRRIRLSDLVTMGASVGVVRLLININGRRYTVQRAFTREKVIETQTYVMNEDGVRVAERDREVTRWVTENLGVDVELFNLLYARQGELRDVLEVNRREEFKLDKLLKIDSMDKLQTEVLRGIERRLEGEAKALEAAIKENSNERERIEKRLSEARARVKELESMISGLGEELSRKEAELSELKNEERRLIGVRERFNTINDELNRLRDELNRLNAEVEELKAKVKEKEMLKARAREIEDKLKASRGLRDEVSRLEELVNELGGRVRELESKESMIKELERQRSDLNRQIRELEDELEELREIRERRRGLEERIREVTLRLRELDELRARRTSLMEELNHINEELNILKQSNEPVCPVCKRPLNPDDRERIIKENAERMKRIREELSSINSRLRDYDNLKEDEEDLRGKLAQVNVAEERIPTLESRLRELRGRLTELNEELEAIKGEVKELAKLREEYNNANARLRQLRNQLKSLESLQEEYLRISAELAKNPEAELNSLLNNKSRIEARVSELEDEAKRLSGELTRLSNIEELVSKVDDEVKGLRARLEQGRGSLSQLISSIGEMENEAKRIGELISKRSERLRFIRGKLQEVAKLASAIEGAKPALRRALLNAINEELRDTFKVLRHKESLAEIYVTEDYEVMVKRSDGRELPVSMLSMGEKNLVALVLRFALSKALLGDIPIMLLDEPTEHLDSEHRRRVSNWLRDLSDVVDTLIVTSHVDAFENTADNVIRVEVVNPRGESVAYNA